MKSKKKIVALAIAVALLLVCFAGATFAYFTDFEAAKTNTITIGNIEIEMYEHFDEYADDPGESELVKNDKYYRETYLGTDVKNIMPGITVPKYTYIENVGNNPAYVRFVVTVPAELDQYLELTFNEPTYKYTKDGNVYTVTRVAPLPAGQLSEPGLMSVKLKDDLTEANIAGFTAAFNDVQKRDFDITVEGHAIQTSDTFADADAAFAVFAANANEKTPVNP